MPALHSPKMERFARFYMETGNAAASYLRAGYVASTRKTLDPAASRLARSCKVQARIRELQGHMIVRNRITVDDLIADLRDDRAQARELKQPSVAVTATMAMAKLAGLIVEKRETGEPGAFANEADVLAKVEAELGADAAGKLRSLLQVASEVDEVKPAPPAPEPLPPASTAPGSDTLN